MKTFVFFKDDNEKPNHSSLFLRLVLGLLSLGILLSLPSRMLALFDGLPWTGRAETLTLVVIIPFLLILRSRFLSFRFSIIFLCSLFLLKSILFFASPSSGWLVKVYPNISQEKSGLFPFEWDKKKGWVKTYASSWNENASAIHNSPWHKKMDFPLDWFLTHSSTHYLKSKPIKSYLETLDVVIEIEGALLIPKDKHFALLAKGIKEGSLMIKNERGDSLILTPRKIIKDVELTSIFKFPKGEKWMVSGKLNYKNAEWSLVPVLIDDSGRITSDLGRDILWQNYDDLFSSLPYILIYKVLSVIVDVGVIIFFLAWVVSTINHMLEKKVLNSVLSIASLSAIFIPFIIISCKVLFFEKFSGLISLLDSGRLEYLGASIIIAGVGFLIWTQRQQDNRNFHDDRIIQSIFLLFGPALLLFFASRWWSSLGRWHDWGAGDDWVAYQMYARRIIVEGRWLDAGEGIFTMQPLYRYLVGVYHWLFGQSAFAQNMSDVWCVLGAAILISCFAKKFRISPLLIFISSIVYFSINLLGGFRIHIGRGLVEYSAMIFMVLAAWFLYRSREGGTKSIVLATLFGVLGYWTRQDHLGAIACLAFLVLEPVAEQTGGLKGYWGRFTIHWKKLVIYWGFGISSVLLICYRNWWLGGAFYPTNKDHPNLSIDSLTTSYKNIFLTVTTDTWPHFPGFSGFVSTFGVLIALLSLVWRPKVIKNFPLSLSVIIVGLLFPYVFLHIWSYVPRYSIHLIPLALLSVTFYLSKYFEEVKFLPNFYSREK